MRILLMGVVLGSVAAQRQTETEPEPAAARLMWLTAEARSIILDWQAEVRAHSARGRASEANPAPYPMRPDFSTLVPKYRAAATDYAGTEDAVPFLMWLATAAAQIDATIATNAVERLAAEHASSKLLEGLGPLLPQLALTAIEPATAGRLISALRQHNAQPNLLAWVALTEHAPTIDSGDRRSKQYAAARATLLARAEAATDAEVQRQIRRRIDIREKLGVGGTASDIVGVDLDGEPFKLSDYRGKVVFLDFWGDW